MVVEGGVKRRRNDSMFVDRWKDSCTRRHKLVVGSENCRTGTLEDMGSWHCLPWGEPQMVGQSSGRKGEEGLGYQCGEVSKWDGRSLWKFSLLMETGSKAMAE